MSPETLSLNWIAIITVTVVSFFFGHLWFGALFSKNWKRIHSMQNMSKAAEKEMMQGMWKLMVSEFLATLLITIGLACVIPFMPYAGVRTAFMVWIGFLLPMTISNSLWGNDQRKYLVEKITITASYRLILVLIAGYVLSIWK